MLLCVCSHSVADALSYVNTNRKGDSTMLHPNTIIKIHSAAFYFARISRDLHQITQTFGVSEWAVRKWKKTQDWQNALEVFGCQGDRNFATKPTRDTVRDNGETFEKARKVYLQAMQAGEPTHKLATSAGDAVGLSRRRIHVWATKYGWRDLIHNNDRQQTGGIQQYERHS